MAAASAAAAAAVVAAADKPPAGEAVGPGPVNPAFSCPADDGCGDGWEGAGAGEGGCSGGAGAGDGIGDDGAGTCQASTDKPRPDQSQNHSAPPACVIPAGSIGLRLGTSTARAVRPKYGILRGGGKGIEGDGGKGDWEGEGKGGGGGGEGSGVEGEEDGEGAGGESVCPDTGVSMM